MISPKCFHCTEELDEPGAILFAPPFRDADNRELSEKMHICAPCYDDLIDLLLESKEEEE